MRWTLPALAALWLFIAGCGSTATTQVLPIQTPLPQQEQAVYRLIDKDGASIGQATLTIDPDPNGARLGQQYHFDTGQRDSSSVTVARDTMRPRAAERTVEDGDRREQTSVSYTADSVAVSFDDGRVNRQRSAAISDTAYDNLESLFLWRTLDLHAGLTLNYVNVVVDPRHGTVSRALASVSVSGPESLSLPGGARQAWRVEFTSAGVTNVAWYADTPGRSLLRYSITRGPTLLLDNATP